LMVSLWVLGQTIDWFPKGNPRMLARSTHISLGVALALVLLVRINWRFGGRAVHLPPVGSAWLAKTATITHWLLYGLLVAAVALGFANAWVRGDTIFDLFKIRAFDSNNKGLRDTIEGWHALAANTLLVLAFFHAAAALAHHFALKDGVLRRMVPSR